jgi:hypothetical protein
MVCGSSCGPLYSWLCHILCYIEIEFDECLCQDEARNEMSRPIKCGHFEFLPFFRIAFAAQTVAARLLVVPYIYIF